MADEMSFKQAQVELRAMVRVFRAFEHVDEILSAAGAAIQAQVNAEEKLVGLLEEIRGLEANLEAGRAKATVEQRSAGLELEHLRTQHFDTEAKFKSLADETRSARERAAQEMSTASELIAKQLKAECEVLEGRKKELTEAVGRVQGDWDAMRERMGMA